MPELFQPPFMQQCDDVMCILSLGIQTLNTAIRLFVWQIVVICCRGDFRTLTLPELEQLQLPEHKW